MKYLFNIILFFNVLLIYAQQVNPVKELAMSKAKSPTVFSNFIPDTIVVNQERNFKHFSIKDGLAQTQINSIFVDSRNLMWIATYGGGINIYNGQNFKTINKKNGLSNDNVWGFIEDQKGRIWIATDQGVSIYDGKSFTYIDTTNGLKAQPVLAIFKDSKNRIWMGTSGGGVSVYENNKIKSFDTTNHTLKDNRVTSITEDNKGNIWIATYAFGLTKFDGKNFISIEQNDKALDRVKCVKADEKGNIWFGTAGGIVVVNSEGKVQFKLTIENGLPTNGINDILIDKNDVWLATFSGIVNYNNEKLEFISKTEGLKDKKVSCLFKDKWNTLWIGMANSGLSQMLNQPFFHYTKESGFPSEIPLAVFKDSKDNIWIGTDGNGIIKFDGKKWMHYNPEKGFNWSTITCFYEDNNNNLWFGTTNLGAVKYDGNKFYQYEKEQGLSNNRIWSITQDKNNEMWFSTNWCVNRFDGNNFYWYNDNSGFPYYIVVTSYRNRQGDLWFGTFGGGAAYYDGTNFTNFDVDFGLKNNAVFSMVTDKFNNTWLSVYGEGLSILRENSETKSFSKETVEYSILNYLKADAISFIKSDRDGNIWLGSNKGLTKVVMKESVFDHDPEFFHYDYHDGFIGEECRLNGFAEDADGSIWIPSKGRVTRFYPKFSRKSKTPPVVYLQSLKLELEEVKWDTLKGAHFKLINKWNNIPDELELDYYNNYLQFDFLGISFDRPEAVEYQWRLDGFNNKWSPWSKKKEITFSNMPPGKYTLRIKARNGDKLESSELAYSFVIYPPFWETIWFRILVIFVVIIVLVIIFRWRTLALRKRQIILEKTVEERTIEVVQQKSIIEEKHKEITDSINYAERIQRSFLATKNLLDENLKDYFVYFNPKESVSGDFYWGEKLSNGNFCLAVADSTGHGVPGAIMSILNITCLENSVKEGLTQPSEILNHTRTYIIERLKKDGSEEGGKDGMDCSLLSFDFRNKKLEFALANNPLWIIRASTGSATNELIEFKGDKMPVGKHDKQTSSFVAHELKLQSGDMIYIFTDGYADQFGGEKGKKFKYANLQKILLENANKELNLQSQILNHTFEKWKGNLEQVDDVCIIGVRI